MKPKLRLNKIAIRELDDAAVQHVAGGETEFSCDGCTMLLTNCTNTCSGSACYCGSNGATWCGSCAWPGQVCS
jgi:hypothetical protein